MDEPIIRVATQADLPALHALVERAYRGDSARRGWTHEADLLDGQRTDLDALADMIAAPDASILVADAAGRIIGCVEIADKGGGTCYLGMLSVDPSSQASGLGKRLIAAAESTAIARGARRMEMTVIVQRPELIAYYERRGYARTGEHRPFPHDDPRFGLPRTRTLKFVVLARALPARQRSPD